jgi:HD superfamily phosphodiesterase
MTAQTLVSHGTCGIILEDKRILGGFGATSQEKRVNVFPVLSCTEKNKGRNKVIRIDIKDSAISKMKQLLGDDDRRIDHALKVLRFSEEILQGEHITGKIAETVILTAILHDIGIHEAERKYNSNFGPYQEIEGPPIAKRMLREMGISNRTIERVCYIIGGHHTPSKVDDIDFQILWEADLLVNIEERGLMNDKNVNLEAIISKNFKTAAGKRIVETLYTDRPSR